jgi:hypothetical protein
MNALVTGLETQKRVQMMYLLEDPELAPLVWRIAALGQKERDLIARMVEALRHPPQGR